MSAAWRERIWGALRLAAGVGVVAWLASSGVIEWPRLRGLLSAWPLTLLAFTFVVAGFVLTSWRFCVLTAPQGLHLTLGNSLRLTLIGNAANFVLPAIGSDLVRLWFAANGHAGRRTEIATIVLLDRVLGLVGILLLPVVLAPLFPDVVRANGVVQWILVLSAALAGVVVLVILMASSRRGLTSAPVQLALRLVPLRGYLQRVLDTIHGYRYRRIALMQAVAWSVGANGCAAACIVCLQQATHPGSAAALGGFLTSLAFVLNNVPLTPGGIGFTETAVASLYRIVGVDGGVETMLGMRVLFLLLTPAGIYLYLRAATSYLTPVAGAPATGGNE